MNIRLTAGRLFTRDAEILYPVIEIDEQGRIAAIGTDPSALAGDSTTLAGALFDVHMHGADGIDAMNADKNQMRELQRFLATHGVAHFLPTTVTASLDSTLRALENMADAIESEHFENEAVPAGIHIEGPFLSHAKRGMHPAGHLQAPSIKLFEILQSAARGHIRMMTIAPEPQAGPFASAQFERVSALELIRHAAGQGVSCSIGHSNANAAEALAAIEAGAVSATHTFNAMRAFNHRDPGILGVVLDDDRIFADLICDGVHVAPEAVRLWWKAKGPERAILITDALPPAGKAEGEYLVGDDWVTAGHGRALVTRDLAQGKETLAGSLLLLDQAVSHFIDVTAASLADGVRLASANPAAMVQRPEIASLTPGSFANLTRWNVNGNLVASYIRGREVKR
ncbi:MAG TPA: N-acetylglucosamine-6-phosphate deacetylase [Acidobacteriaceae bacterium]|nr:N-acetylglucosamine-6-phosphate deacetylase [Acidobacteriaceae bacterium]